MVCSQEIREYDHELQLWKDFPKGLRVLLLCNDTDSASHTQIKLEQMDYIGMSKFHVPSFLYPRYFMCMKHDYVCHACLHIIRSDQFVSSRMKFNSYLTILIESSHL